MKYHNFTNDFEKLPEYPPYGFWVRNDSFLVCPSYASHFDNLMAAYSEEFPDNNYVEIFRIASNRDNIIRVVFGGPHNNIMYCQHRDFVQRTPHIWEPKLGPLPSKGHKICKDIAEWYSGPDSQYPIEIKIDLTEAKLVIESVTEAEYNQINSGQPFTVIFGTTFYDETETPIVSKTYTGTNENDHTFLLSKYPQYDYLEHLNWRYVPLTNTVYWWEKPFNTDFCDDAESVLPKTSKKKRHVNIASGIVDFNEDQLRNMWASHGRRYVDPSDTPTFKQFYKQHTDPKNWIYRRSGD